MPQLCGSTSEITAFAAIAASIALPPRSSTCAPALAASGWLAATTPYFVATFERPGITSWRAGMCDDRILSSPDALCPLRRRRGPRVVRGRARRAAEHGEQV